MVDDDVEIGKFLVRKVCRGLWGVFHAPSPSTIGEIVSKHRTLAKAKVVAQTLDAKVNR